MRAVASGVPETKKNDPPCMDAPQRVAKADLNGSNLFFRSRELQWGSIYGAVGFADERRSG